MFGSLKASVISLTKQPGISYGRMLTTLELIWWVLQKISCPNKKMGGLDIPTTRYAKSPLIGKLVWDMLQASCKFWVNILSKKYVSNAVFFRIRTL